MQVAKLPSRKVLLITLQQKQMNVLCHPTPLLAWRIVVLLIIETSWVQEKQFIALIYISLSHNFKFWGEGLLIFLT